MHKIDTPLLTLEVLSKLDGLAKPTIQTCQQLFQAWNQEPNKDLI